MRSIQFLKGVGEKRAKLFEKLDIYTVFDLITYYPRDYEDRSQIKEIGDTVLDETVCIKAVVASPVISRRIRKGLEIARIKVADSSGAMTLVFFNQKYLRDSLKEGETYIFYGKVSGNLLGREMHNPTFELAQAYGSKTGRIVPIYPLTAGISQNIMAKCLQNAIGEYSEELSDPLDEKLRERYKLCHARFALENIHNPKDFESLAIAKRRLTFEELFVFSAGLMMLKGRRVEVNGCKFDNVDISEFLDKLPFALTGAQLRATREAIADMCKDAPMNRLVQGDVGSGKTVVAAISAYVAWKSKYQSAVMVPTEILAEQHFKSFTELFSGFGVNIELLCGSMTAATKRDIKRRLGQGEIDIIIGTHALLTEDVEFSRLGLVVTDEQHRFGVRQRSALLTKGENPNLLVMSATPIPRTLALILYGDLELSVIDELPPGRKPVDTFAVGEAKRESAYGFVRKELQAGRQAYIVCPLVEENEELELKSVEEFAENLKRGALRGARVEILHGKMKAKDKEAIMREFTEGRVHALVSTTVIEVGVNVPNATVMIVENAERFGLSQLHQLRGRVGRGRDKSYCILFSDASNKLSRERLAVLCKTNDGFKISEEDLRLRGPGDFFGTRQHGVPALKIADLALNSKALKVAQDEAKALIEDDPMLQKPQNKELLERIHILFKKEEFGDIFN